jgi:hypothetical protein
MPTYLEFDIGIARLTEYNADKFPVVQIDAYGEEQSGVAPYEVHSPQGLISRCFDPQVDGDGTSMLGCTVLYALDGGQGHAWIQSDPRVIPLLPPMKKGGTCLYGGTIKNPSFHNIDGETGSQTIYVPYKFVNDVATKSMTISVNVDDEDKESISILHGSGAMISIVQNGDAVHVVLKNKDGSAYIEVADKGVTINGPLTVNGSINSGGSSAAKAVALAIPTASALNAIATALTGIASAVAAVAPGAGAPAAAAQAQIQAALSILATKNTTAA